LLLSFVIGSKLCDDDDDDDGDAAAAGDLRHYYTNSPFIFHYHNVFFVRHGYCCICFRIHVDDPINAIRIILPDVGVFIVTLLIFICCRVLLQPQQPPATADDAAASTALTGNDRTNVVGPAEHGRLFKYGVMIGDFLGNFVVVMLMGACGIALPSIINSVYFLLFVAVLTLWSCCVCRGTWFACLRYVLLIYLAVHVITIHLTQFEFMQYAWDNHGNETVVER